MRNFQILVIPPVKICKQCLQTASAFEGLRPPDPLPELRSWTALEDFRPQTSWAIVHQMKIPGPTTSNPTFSMFFSCGDGSTLIVSD